MIVLSNRTTRLVLIHHQEAVDGHRDDFRAKQAATLFRSPAGITYCVPRSCPPIRRGIRDRLRQRTA